MRVEVLGTIAVKLLKLLLNLVILIIYRVGYGGGFLGVGGTWNLNEEKSPDSEIIASGIFVGFFIYTSVMLLAYIFGSPKKKKGLSDTVMNVVGVLCWLGVGGTALHYWVNHEPEFDMMFAVSEIVMGIILGVLCLLVCLLYLVDCFLSFSYYARSNEEKY